MKSDELSEDLMRKFAYQATGDVCPMQAVIGGIAAQEVMKVCHVCTGRTVFDPANESTYLSGPYGPKL